MIISKKITPRRVENQVGNAHNRQQNSHVSVFALSQEAQQNM